MGVGDGAKDISALVKRDRECMIHLNKVGTIMVVEGPTKAQVGMMAERIARILKQGVYTGKGAKIACNPIKRKSMKKK